METSLACVSRMAVAALAAVLAFGAVGLCAEPNLPRRKKWKLLWHDEFDGHRLDETKWTRRHYKCRDGWIVDDAVYLDGKGNLVIKVYEKDGKYYSGIIDTRGKFEHEYGYWEARCKLPSQPGHWAAFWLWSPMINPPTPSLLGPAAAGTEIDVMEYLPRDGDIVHHTLHWYLDTPGNNHHSASHSPRLPGISKGYHTFAVEWTPREYVFYVDGKVTWRTSRAISHREQYVLLSEEIEAWAGRIQDAKLPDFFVVDYVRVYDRAR